MFVSMLKNVLKTPRYFRCDPTIDQFNLDVG